MSPQKLFLLLSLLYLRIKYARFPSSTKFFGPIYPPSKIHITPAPPVSEKIVRFSVVDSVDSRASPLVSRLYPSLPRTSAPFPRHVRRSLGGLAASPVVPQSWSTGSHKVGVSKFFLREESKLITSLFSSCYLMRAVLLRKLCIDYDPEVQTTWTIIVVIERDLAHSRVLKYSAEISIYNHNIYIVGESMEFCEFLCR
jgi:hypothetical protein